MNMDNNDNMWVSGWLLGKYENRSNVLPKTIEEAAEWYEGFTKGSCESLMYHRLDEYLDEMMPNKAVKDLIKAANNAEVYYNYE